MTKTILRSLATSTTVLACVLLASATTACSDDEEKSAATACTDMCTSAGYASTRLEEAPHETNCYCVNGSAALTAQACTDMCTSIGKTKSERFSGTAGPLDACQCS